jgi:KDO2-lipid IV(A) lauroyltransferase
MRDFLEWALVKLILTGLGILPRRLARALGAGVGWLAYTLAARLRKTALRNLELAYPDSTAKWRDQITRRIFRNLGWQLGEIAHMQHWRKDGPPPPIRYDGLEHYLAGQARGKGVLFLTAHLGAWELSSFYHSMMGHPLEMVIRRLDNRRLDALVNGIRCKFGNRVLHKDDFARGLLLSMRKGGTVGILMDTNMTPPQGVFVPFFGHLAYTASGLARVAIKTGAAVVPGFAVWEESEQQYVLRFGEPMTFDGNDAELAPEARVIAATARLAAVTEQWIRRYPDQWLWVHRRWKTRPEGEPGLY